MRQGDVFFRHFWAHRLCYWFYTFLKCLQAALQGIRTREGGVSCILHAWCRLGNKLFPLLSMPEHNVMLLCCTLYTEYIF